MRWWIFKKREAKPETEVPEDGFLFLGGGLGIEDKNIKYRKKIEWVEETFIDYKEEDLARTGKNYLGIALSNRRLVMFFLVILSVLFLLLLEAFYLQVVRGEYYYGLAEKNRLRTMTLISPRGIIYDTNEIPLVKNIPSFAVYITMYDLVQNLDEDREKALNWLKENITEFDYQESLDKVLATKITAKEYFEPVLVVDGISYEKALAMRIQSSNYLGINIEVSPKREYVTNYQGLQIQSLSHVLGYPGKISPEEFGSLKDQGYLLNDNIGKTGIEAILEKQLRGKYGREQIEVDSTGKAIKIIARDEMVKGDNLFLALDLNMQAKMEEILEKYLAKLKTKRASAVVMDPQTGKVYAIVSLPGFNNNDFSFGISNEKFVSLLNDPDKPLFNRVISGEYPSGSTIKPVIASGALEEGVINENSSFLSTGGVRIGSWFFPDWKAGGHGVTNVRKALADSVNTFFYIIGGGYGDFEGLGPWKMKSYGEMFGLGQKTNIQLPNERAGFLPDPDWKVATKDEPWYIGDTYHMAIGQGDVLVTPLQVANFTAVFANGGTLYRPQLVDRYFDQSKKEMITVESEILNEKFVAGKTIDIIRAGMRQSVTNGSSRILNSLPVTSAGKTGTAQWGTDENPHSWFTSFAPYNNAELVVTVLVDEGGEGSAIAAPVAYEFMNWYFRYYKKSN